MNVNQLKATLGAGANPSRFNIHIPVPVILRGINFGSSLISKIPLVNNIMTPSSNTIDDDVINILAKRTSLPEKNIEPIEINHRGVKYVVRGVAQFPNRWEVTFHNTADLALRRFFDEWMYQIHRHDHGLLPATTFPTNYFGLTEINSGYMTDIRISQLCADGTKTYTVELNKAFPISVSAVELDSSRPNEISEFTVTFAYSYWNAMQADQTNPFEKTNKLISALSPVNGLLSKLF